MTRKSLIQIAQDHNIPCEVRPVRVQEIKDAAANGSLKEVFGAGTAAVVSPISAIQHRDDYYALPVQEDSIAAFLKQKLMAIQYNEAEDPHNWRYKV